MLIEMFNYLKWNFEPHSFFFRWINLIFDVNIELIKTATEQNCHFVQIEVKFCCFVPIIH